jgi:hypothetical protein
MKKLICLVAFLGILWFPGCQIIDKSRVQGDDTDNMPWNTRAGWEDSSFGVRY